MSGLEDVMSLIGRPRRLHHFKCFYRLTRRWTNLVTAAIKLGSLTLGKGMRNTVFIHTNEKQMLGAIVALGRRPPAPETIIPVGQRPIMR